jgi:hypothetical protein
MFITGYDAREAAQHDLDTIAGYPSWVQLNRDVTGKTSDWKRNISPCNEKPPPVGKQCDEYPFISTVQGGPATTVPPKPQADLRWIDTGQNTLQGWMLGGFYSNNTYTSLGGLKGCNLTTGQLFLAIPLPPVDEDIKTTWACNGTNPGP